MMRILAYFLWLSAVVPAASDPYRDSIEAWRAQRLERLTAPDGYLAVAGFWWLAPGENTVGSSPDNTVVLPPGTAPSHAGTIFVNDGGTVDLRFEAAARALIDGEPVGFRRLEYGPAGSDRIQMGRVTFWVMERDGRPSVRLLDPESETRRTFTGLEHYPVDPAYRVRGTYEAFPQPRPMKSDNYLGYEDVSDIFGRVVFELRGETLALLPYQDSPADTVLFFVFADATTGEETYGGGRFVYANLKADGTVDLDFNKAYNPPCAFNPYTTCPLPAEENRLAVPVRAGEIAYRGKTKH